MNVEEMKKHYQDNLKPEYYNEFILNDFRVNKTEYVNYVKVLYDTMKSGKYKGKRLLEIGSGATVHHIASASAYFEEIIQSDFVDANCEELKKWLNGESKLDWSEILKAVAEVEGHSDLEKGVRDISARIRKSVKNVVHCDVLESPVIPVEAGKDFDLIITCFALEAAAPDFESYVDVLKRLHGLLRPGGGILMLGLLNMANWPSGPHRFPYLRLNREDIGRALEMAKFGEKICMLIPKTLENNPYMDYDQAHFVSAIAL